MNALRNFAFEEKLVRVVEIDGQPWFAGKDVCAALDIRDHNQALESLDADERGGYNVPTPGGAQQMIVVSMPGVFRLIFRSRKPDAERFKRWLAHEVLPAIAATGRYEAPHMQPAPVMTLEDEAAQITRLRLDIAKEARIQFGPARARLLWDRLGLPAVPTLTGDAAGLQPTECLSHLLSYETGDGTIAALLVRGFAGDQDVRETLLANGIRIEGQSFVVANSHPGVRAIFEEGPWWPAYPHLRGLAGASTAEVMKFGRGMTSRGVAVPRSWLDA